MQWMRMSGHVGKCSCSMSTAGPMTVHLSTGQPITRLGHIRACWSSVCAGVRLKGHPLGQCSTAQLNASCAYRCHSGHVRISPARNFCMQAVHGAAFNDDHCDCGAERIWKCCLMQRSQNMCPHASSVAGQRGRLWQMEHGRLFCDSTFNPLLVKTLRETQGIDLHASQPLREARRREPQRYACAGARRWWIPGCCALRLCLLDEV